MARLRLIFALLFPLVVFAEPTDLTVTRIVLTETVVDQIGNPVTVDNRTIYCGSSSGNYTKSTDIGTSLEANLSDAGIDGVNYCAATVSSGAVESSYSDEVVAINTLGKFARVGLDAPGLRLE